MFRFLINWVFNDRRVLWLGLIFYTSVWLKHPHWALHIDNKSGSQCVIKIPLFRQKTVRMYMADCLYYGSLDITQTDMFCVLTFGHSHQRVCPSPNRLYLNLHPNQKKVWFFCIWPSIDFVQNQNIGYLYLTNVNHTNVLIPKLHL